MIFFTITINHYHAISLEFSNLSILVTIKKMLLKVDKLCLDPTLMAYKLLLHIYSLLGMGQYNLQLFDKKI